MDHGVPLRARPIQLPRNLNVMFNFAVDRKYILKVPISNQSRVTVKHGKPGILAVEQCARSCLMRRQHPSFNRNRNVCRTSARIRNLALDSSASTSPRSMLTWSRWRPRTAATTLPSACRYVGQSHRMALALSQGQGSGLPVESYRYYIRLEKACRFAGIEDWPHDALRHSFCSYHYAKHNDAGKTMAQAGIRTRGPSFVTIAPVCHL